MKSILFVCTVLVANGIAANVNRQDKVINQILHKVPKINEYFTECIIQTKISEDDTENGTLLLEEEDRIANKLTHCLYRKTGILGNDGKLNVDAAKSILTLIGVEQDEVNKIVNKCVSTAGIEEPDMAYAAFRCFEDDILH
uniref:SFRICE025044.2 n=1 Tax=Spodoptera frugiperda TaxID=7108 RepID=A0A2H1X1T4_SPOFR